MSLTRVMRGKAGPVLVPICLCLPAFSPKPQPSQRTQITWGATNTHTPCLCFSTQKYVRTSKGSALSRPKVCKVTHTVYNALELDGEEHTEITFDRAVLHPSTLRH